MVEKNNGRLLSLGWTMIAGMIFFTLAGMLLDKHFGTKNIWTLVGMLLGGVYGGYEVWKIVIARNKDEEQRRGGEKK